MIVEMRAIISPVNALHKTHVVIYGIVELCVKTVPLNGLLSKSWNIKIKKKYAKSYAQA